MSYEEGYAAWVATVSGGTNDEPVRIAAPPAAGRSAGQPVVVPVIDCADWALALRFAFAATHRLSFRIESDGSLVTEMGFARGGSSGSTVHQSFLRALGLAETTARMGARVLASFRSADLASDINTYRVAFDATRTGDLVSDTGHTRVIGRLVRAMQVARVSLIAGFPSSTPGWSRLASHELLAGVEAGSGPRRFRTEGRLFAADSIAREYELWSFGIDRDELLSLAIRNLSLELSSRPIACHNRTRLIDAMITLYRLRRNQNTALTWPMYLATMIDAQRAVAFAPELVYDVSPTCAWNPDTAERSLIWNALDGASAIIMRNGRYPYSLGVTWRNDENRTFATMNDQVSARACAALSFRFRGDLGCSGDAAVDPPALSTE